MRAVGSTIGHLSHNGSLSVAAAPSADVVFVGRNLLFGRLVCALVEKVGPTAVAAGGGAVAAQLDFIASTQPKLVLIDCSDMELARDVCRNLEGTQVAGISVGGDALGEAAMLEAGAAVIVDATQGPAELVALIELAFAGQELMDPAKRHQAMARLRRHRAVQQQSLRPFERLTEREAEALQMIAQGWGAAEIAAEWDVAMATVRSHIRSVLAKLNVKSQLQAAITARESGWYGIMCSASSILTMPGKEETGIIARQGGSWGS